MLDLEKVTYLLGNLSHKIIFLDMFTLILNEGKHNVLIYMWVHKLAAKLMLP